MRPRIACALILLLAACGSEDEIHAVPPDVAPTYMIYSPNGEPLNGGPLGKPTCTQAVGGWFDRMSAGSGHITKDAFLSDTRTQFDRMDIDHNGYIVSEELDRFREPYRQQPPAKKQEKDEEGGKHGHKGKGGKADVDMSDLSYTTADPVMSADANLDFKVSPQEFAKQAVDVFARIDANHDGMLDRAETLAQCEQKKP